MTYMIDEWDSTLNAQVTRPATAQEAAAIDAQKLELPAVPQSVTRRQGIQMLRLSGITEAMVEAKIEALVQAGLHRDLALIEFRTSQVFERNRQLTIMLGAAFALDLDALFISGAAL